MTRSICVLTAGIRSNLAFLKAIASFYSSEQPSGGSSSCRLYVAGSLCIMGLSLFSAVHVPDAIAHPHFRPAQYSTDDYRQSYASASVQGDGQRDTSLWTQHSAFHPPDDLGLPNRREPGGTR